MATITKSSTGYKVDIRKSGFSRYSKTFSTKTEAKNHGIWVEAEMARGTWVDKKELKLEMVSNVLLTFLADNECDTTKTHTLKRMAREFEGLSFNELTAEYILNYCRARRETVSQNTVGKEISFLGQCIDYCRVIKGLNLTENIAKVVKPFLSKEKLIGSSVRRDRRPTPEEIQLIFTEIDRSARNDYLRDMILIAMDGGMRQGEIHAMKWSEIDFQNNTISIWERKDNRGRTKGRYTVIPMLKQTAKVLAARRDKLQPEELDSRVFPECEYSRSISDKFARLCKKVGIEGLRFHDLRHEAISSLFESGLQIHEVAQISSHHDWKQLERYTNLKPESLGGYENNNMVKVH